MNNNINDDINGAIKLIKPKLFYNPKFSKHCGIYAFTNENLNGYFNKLNINENTAALTVAGSGDHTIELLIRNCRNIKIFDINNLTKYYIELKIAGIKALSYNEFINFFVLEDNIYDAFNERSYNKIRNFLNEEFVIFWDALYSKFSGNKIRKSRLFFSTEESYKFLKNFISYMNPINYQKIKYDLLNENLNLSSSFTNCNMKNICKIYKDKFDIILLSNIADYITEIYKNNSLEKFRNYIENNLNNMLNNNGIICAAYLFWAELTKQNKIPIINNNYLRQKLFTDNFEEWLIDNSSLKDCTDDYLLVYRKS